MKKNLLSIVILSLLVVNIIMTAIMMFSVMGTNQKTAAIVTDIAGILQLELEGENGGGNPNVSLADTQVYEIPNSMTILLQREEGETSDRYAVVKVSLALDMTHEDFATYGADIEAKASLIQGEIISVIGSYTPSEARLSQDEICEEILERVQNLYGSTFIYKVSIIEMVIG